MATDLTTFKCYECGKDFADTTVSLSNSPFELFLSECPYCGSLHTCPADEPDFLLSNYRECWKKMDERKRVLEQKNIKKMQKLNMTEEVYYKIKDLGYNPEFIKIQYNKEKAAGNIGEDISLEEFVDTLQERYPRTSPMGEDEKILSVSDLIVELESKFPGNSLLQESVGKARCLEKLLKSILDVNLLGIQPGIDEDTAEAFATARTIIMNQVLSSEKADKPSLDALSTITCATLLKLESKMTRQSRVMKALPIGHLGKMILFALRNELSVRAQNERVIRGLDRMAKFYINGYLLILLYHCIMSVLDSSYTAKDYTAMVSRLNGFQPDEFYFDHPRKAGRYRMVFEECNKIMKY